MTKRRRGDLSEQALGEHYRRQYDHNYHQHLRGTTEERLLQRRERATKKRYTRYFLRVVVFVLLGLGFMLGPQAYEMLRAAIGLR